MSINNAKKLVRKFEQSNEFRRNCYQKSPKEFIEFLKTENLIFDFNEMEDSLRLQVLDGLSYSEAMHLFGIYDVIRVLLDWPSFEFELPTPAVNF